MDTDKIINKPNHRISYKAKLRLAWYKPTINYYISLALNNSNYENIKSWLNAANGVIDDTVFLYLTKPILGELKSNISLPDEIRDLDFITPIREKNLGEYIELPYKFQVMVHNDDVIMERNAKVKEQILKLMKQALVNEINANGIQGNPVEQAVPSKPVPDLNTFAKDFIANYLDGRAIKGQTKLEYINYINNFDTQRLQAFYFWWATEHFYTYRSIVNDEVSKEVLHPLSVYTVGDEEFVEDRNVVLIHDKISYDDLLLYYDKLLPAEEKEYIAKFSGVDDANTSISVATAFLESRLVNIRELPTTDGKFTITGTNKLIDRYRVFFISERKTKILTYQSLDGEELTEEVDEEYTLDKAAGDISLETIYIPEVYMGIRFGDENTGVYIPAQPEIVQRYHVVTHKPKMPVNGRDYVLDGIKNNPIPNRLIPFQIIDRIIWHHMELNMAKYKYFIEVVPKSMLNDDSAGTSKEKMYYMKQDNLLTYDDSEVDFNTAAQAFRIVQNPGLERYLMGLNEIRMQNKREAYEIANMNDERAGQGNANDKVSNFNANLNIAKLGSVLMVNMFNKTLELDHIADLEFAKYAYIKGKKGAYFNSNGEPVLFDTDGMEDLDVKYGLSVSNSIIDQRTLQAWKDLAFAAAQNREFGIAATAIDAQNISKIRNAIVELDKLNKELANSQQVSQEKISQQQIEANQQALAFERETIMMKTKLEGEYELEKERIKASTVTLGLDANNNKIDDSSDIIARSKERMDAINIELKQRELANKQWKDREDVRLKDKEIDANKYIAKINKN